MNRVFFIIAIAVGVILTSSCNTTTEKAANTNNLNSSPSSESSANKVTLPTKTSLGDLVKIENKDQVTTDKETILPKSEEVIYVLNFEGKKEIQYSGIESSNAFDVLYLPLVDSNGKEFVPIFVGSRDKKGNLSNKDMENIVVSVVRKEGGVLKPVPTGAGKIVLSEPKLTLVYVLPKGASHLALKDRGQRYPVN
jgi:hypothetical protein